MAQAVFLDGRMKNSIGCCFLLDGTRLSRYDTPTIEMESDMSVSYEWVLEELDDHGDIQSVDHYSGLKDLLHAAEHLRKGGHKWRCGLVRDRFDTSGYLNRSWAYVENGRLPTHLTFSDDGVDIAVPKRYSKEFEDFAIFFA